MEKINYRHPSALDKEPYGTVFVVLNKNDQTEYFVQTNTFKVNPKWERIGEVLEKLMHSYFLNINFSEDVLNLRSMESNKEIVTSLCKLISDCHRLDLF